MLGLASVEQELVVELRRPVALARRRRLDSEVLPVRLHQVLEDMQKKGHLVAQDMGRKQSRG